ncbi:aldose epimerase [Corynebacterium pseudodiphtheriticum]|nr:aldose epimerase [Corynebacterium pseudodiphtheriticum]RUP93681.1 aldose epimerase [Corynebacterium pseudodiphtheriticum]RUP98424.1 aldose epimerase [Corynebacterium pseudodiphtheriticum]RUP98886.1 aldose epimerase [Corynebacterium pseudodiphtheriticum]RUQ47204.1 aldose epimerase [Corynebacterium pseudodiphtheriticum]
MRHTTAMLSTTRLKLLGMTSHAAVQISAGTYTATIDPHGAGLATLLYDGKPLVAGYTRTRPMTAGALLAPWPNRTGDGIFSHHGSIHRLACNEADRNNALHGFAAEAAWEITDRSPGCVTLQWQGPARTEWAWPLHYSITWALAGDGLSAELTVTNTGTESAHPGTESSPFGLGWHPYLSALGAPLDECTLSMSAATNLPLDPDRLLPAGPEIPATEIVDKQQHMAGIELDHCFRLEAPQTSSDHAAHRIELRNADGHGAILWADEHFSWCQVYTSPESAPSIGRAVAVEPMTCPPNALRSGESLLQLASASSMRFRFGISATSTPPHPKPTL